ncbi:DNA methyltransferase 1-associated protein 1-like isoform X1 [Biomphalaria glabrata]|uniref:DNA methyltransferase 1-associated protein 1 n=2 Tax=Biomphalaria glabrata TaxID=6526 RepID=A0A9W3ATS3_BIOGL|nr:DNA methyltransferase 1-associated protein 1-like isoform X1 [Biomphalaria glabrata]XP_055890684.1 DNA methyltransferase 1-associated protein 1-like isoform X1 [Biomphalaria glabrata]XP_055890685.1 DNA methyltransferase 1-associated protein 1-like isoform X1 [Biomphalaria glabrata]XP_055890686.1 DNA methyltransferase 1-associated protein 1-like isoform X1 [Biomphalaria glabrata]XP_055890687.1 DNA methyltransferase 1-associated protein 1-like isoform X1 [Biomphalaria glabrata]XP_055890688.1 
MASSMDVRDILELDTGQMQNDFVTKESLMYDGKKKKVKKPDASIKRPEGMHRELWGLLHTDSRYQTDAAPIIPSDTKQGYKQMKAKIGSSRVRPWKWMPFTNAARKDGAVFYHWGRVADEGKDYPFARFNKSVDIPVFSDLEYQQHLHDDNWTRQETDHLFELCRRFDLRFIIVHDRWDREKYKEHSVEDLKERYYNICNTLAKVRAPQGAEPKIKAFDAEHERRRKSQLTKLFDRTQEQVEEEEFLIGELKKIELRKKEREKKQQDLQKLITAADTNADNRKAERKNTKKKLQAREIKDGGILAAPEPGGIKFPDFKASGTSLRSQRMKLPATIGQKKTKAIEQVLEELGLEFNPMPTDEIVNTFNMLRQDIVLLYELKLAMSTCEYELQTLKHRHDQLIANRNGGSSLSSYLQSSVVKEPDTPTISMDDGAGESSQDGCAMSPAKRKLLMDTIDVVGTASTPSKKRKAAIEQSQVLKKIKQKM